MVTLGVCTYGSDGLRRRAAITTGSTTTTTDFVLDNSMFVRELRSNAGVAYNYATYLVGPRGPEYRRDDVGNTVRWYVYDGLGSVLAEVDPNGTVTASRKYDVYGGVRSSTGTSTSKHKFVGSLGHPSDDESGLIYMQARYMDPQIGRFITKDPNRQDVNWFVYGANNPVNQVDPDGHISVAEWVMEAAYSYLFNWGIAVAFGFASGSRFLYRIVAIGQLIKQAQELYKQLDLTKTQLQAAETILMFGPDGLSQARALDCQQGIRACSLAQGIVMLTIAYQVAMLCLDAYMSDDNENSST